MEIDGWNIEPWDDTIGPAYIATRTDPNTGDKTSIPLLMKYSRTMPSDELKTRIIKAAHEAIAQYNAT